MRSRSRLLSGGITGFLDRDAEVTGELRFSGTLRVDGAFHGSIASEDALIVGKNAVVHADISVAEIEVYGCVSGKIVATRRIWIHSSGKVRGDVSTPTLVVEAGATLDGRSRMDEDQTPEAAPESKEYKSADEAH